MAGKKTPSRVTIKANKSVVKIPEQKAWLVVNTTVNLFSASPSRAELDVVVSEHGNGLWQVPQFLVEEYAKAKLHYEAAQEAILRHCEETGQTLPFPWGDSLIDPAIVPGEVQTLTEVLEMPALSKVRAVVWTDHDTGERRELVRVRDMTKEEMDAVHVGYHIGGKSREDLGEGFRRGGEQAMREKLAETRILDLLDEGT